MTSRSNSIPVYIVLSLSIFFLSGCGPSTPEPVTEINEIVGTWKTDPPGLAMRIEPDGSGLWGITVTRINEGGDYEFQMNFEEDLLIVNSTSICDSDQIGSYKAQMLPSGNLDITLVEDECTHRQKLILTQSEMLGITDKEWVRFE